MTPSPYDGANGVCPADLSEKPASSECVSRALEYRPRGSAIMLLIPPSEMRRTAEAFTIYRWVKYER